jgi:hypothetical protein
MKFPDAIASILTLAAALFALPSIAFAQAATGGEAKPPAAAGPSKEDLAKLTQNPIANLISVPFQNNANLNYGPEKKTQNILNIQPIIPFEINKDWNLITRTVVPVMYQPATAPDESSTSGIGATQFSSILSPASAEGLIWGAGAIVQIPTTTNTALGSERWGLGPTFVILRLEKGSPWVYGFTVHNVWSVGGGAGGSYNSFQLQPFVNYNFAGGTYLSSSPYITADWQADSGNKWTIPIGIGIGHIFHLGRLPMNAQFGGYYNVVRPDDGPNWQIRLQVQFMFPK